MQIPVIKLRETAIIPEYHSPGAAAFDISAAQDIAIPACKLAKIATGLVFAIPQDHFLLIAARSSLAHKKGLILANGIGILDSDYQGPEDELFISVYNITSQEVNVLAGERIAQGIVLPREKVIFTEGKTKQESRGGFGHSGGYLD